MAFRNSETVDGDGDGVGDPPPCRRRSSNKRPRTDARGGNRGGLPDHHDAAFGDGELPIAFEVDASCACSSTTVCLSNTALRTTAPGPIRTPGMITQPRHKRPREAIRTSEAITEVRMHRDDRPAPTMDSCALPPSTNFAGGSGGRLVRIGPLPVVEIEDRVDADDQVHVGIVVGVQRTDVAPVAVVAIRLARHHVGLRSRRPTPGRPRSASG